MIGTNAGPIPTLLAFSNRNAGLQRANTRIAATETAHQQTGLRSQKISRADGEPRLGVGWPVIRNLLHSGHQHRNGQEAGYRSGPEYQPKIIAAQGHEVHCRERPCYSGDRKKRLPNRTLDPRIFEGGHARSPSVHRATPAALMFQHTPAMVFFAVNGLINKKIDPGKGASVRKSGKVRSAIATSFRGQCTSRRLFPPVRSLIRSGPRRLIMPPYLPFAIDHFPSVPTALPAPVQKSQPVPAR